MSNKVVKKIELTAHPFDRWDGVHATGNLCVFEDGTHEVEYEDSNFEYADDYVWVTEEEENEEYRRKSGVTVVKVVYLNYTPLVKCQPGWRRSFAPTGRFVTLSTGESYVEYEDEIGYPDDPNCEYVYEEEDEE